jgi:hypothetical protein
MAIHYRRLILVAFAAFAVMASDGRLLDAATLDLDAHGNGEKITGFDLSPLVSVSSLQNGSSGHLGVAIFDTDPSGPNSGGLDQDLLVDRGNALILQNGNFPDDFAGSDFFEIPNDDEDGGAIVFDFVTPVTMSSIDLIDVNGRSALWVLLTDGSDLTRLYRVPNQWTGETPGTIGWATLDLTTLADQEGPGPGGPATATEDVGFDPTNVLQLLVFFSGSAATNNILFVPEPAAVAWGWPGLIALLAQARRRRNTR